MAVAIGVGLSLAVPSSATAGSAAGAARSAFVPREDGALRPASVEPPEGFAFEQGRAAPLVIENTPGDPEKGTLEVRSLAVGDLNGDGFSDLVAAYYRGNLNPLDWSYLAVMRGNGDGTFENPTSYPLPDAKSPGVRGLVLGDFDDDDDLDVVVSVPDQPEVRFFPNDGTGALGTPVFTPMASGPDDLVAADVDGDGVLDLVTVNPNDDSVSFLAGAGDGTFDIPVDVTTGDAPYSVAVGDFDGQNGLDLAAGTWAGRRVYVFLHDGGGGFGPPVSLLPFGTAGRPHKLWADDFTGDGATDLVAAGPATVPGCPECLVTLPGDGAGNFTVPDPAVTPEAFTPIENMGLRNTGSVDGYPTPPSDVDDDGDLDVVLNHYDQDVVTIARNDGAGRFATDVWAPGSGSDADFPATEDNFGQHYRDLSQSLAVWPDDLDGDGAIDLAVAFDPARFRPGGIVILDGDPSSPGRLRAPEVFGAGSQLNFADNAGDVLAVADWDENGTQDVVFLNRSPGRLGYLPGAGDGTFGEPVIDTVPFGPCTAGRDFTLTDVDRDTHLDLVCRDGGVLYGDGTGGVSEAVTIGTVSAFLTRANSLGVGDLDGDDDLDVVLTSTDGSGNVVARVFRQDSSTREWSEADPVTLGVGSAPVLEVGDVDGDDDIDVVAHLTGTLGSVARLVTVRNNGDATFAAPEVSNDAGFPAGSLVLGLELGDVDGDDDLDPVLFRDSRDDDEGSVAPRLNDGSGVFADPVEHRASPRHSTRLVDIDGDGALDAAANSTAFGLEVLPGNGDGSFGAPLRFTAGEARPGGIDFGDLDGDDDLDAVVSRTANPSPPAQSVVALLREGTGVPPSGEPDLAVDEVTAPDEVEPGAPAEISYTARNDGDGPADGSWTDSVWLSADDTWDLDDRLLGTVPRSGVLAAGAEYTETVEAPFDPLLSGDHTVIVRADSRDLLDESTETNNDGRSPPVTLDIPTLDVGSDLDLTLEDGRAHYVQLPVAEGQSTLFELLAPVGDIATVDLVRDRVPVPARDIVLPDPASTTRQVALPPDGAGTWFVRLLGRDAAGTGTDVTVRASDLPFGILGVDPDEGSNRGTATLTIDGVGFDPSTRPLLVADDDTVVAPIARNTVDGSTIVARFNLLGAEPGVYDLVATRPDGDPFVLADAFSVTDDPGGHLELYTSAPPRVRPGFTGRFTTTVRNTGSADLPVTEFRIDAVGARLRLPGQQRYSSSSMVFGPDDSPTADGPVPAGLIPPGAIRRVAVDFSATGGAVQLTAEILEPDPEPLPPPVPDGFVIEDVSGPATATSQDHADVTFTIRNDGDEPISGPWPLLIRPSGEIELLENAEGQEDPFLFVNLPEPFDAFETTAGENVTLAPGETQTFFRRARVPPAVDGEYHWLVEHAAAAGGPVTTLGDDEFQTSADYTQDDPDGSSWSTDTVTIDTPVLDVDGFVDGTLFADRSTALYRIDPSPEALRLAFEFSPQDLRVVAERGRFPVFNTAAHKTETDGRQDVDLDVPGGDEPLYVLVSLEDRSPLAVADFALRPSVHPESVEIRTPEVAGTAGPVTVDLRGVGFDTAESFTLTGPDGGSDVITADDWLVEDTFSAWANFDLTSAAPGEYTLTVERGADAPLVADDPLTVQAGGAPELEVSVDAPDRMRWERPNPVLLTYTNTGAVDLRLPLLTVATDAGGELHLLPDRADADDDITLVPPPVLPGRPVVPAGASRTLTLWYTPPLTDEEITFSVWATPFEDPDLADRSLEWDADAADPPAGVDPAVWEEFIDGERARYGETWGALSDYISSRYEALGSAGLTGAVFVDGQWLFYPGNGSRPGTFRTDRPVGELAAYHTDLDTAFTAGLNLTYDAGTPPAPSQLRPRQIGGGDGVQNVYAVIVGNPDGTLGGANQDALQMASTLTDTYNVPSANVTLLRNNVSRTEGLGAVSAAVNNPEMDGDDLLFVMNASHGHTQPRGEGDRGTRAYNGFADANVTSDDWEAALDGVQTPTLFLNDSCYSSEITFDIDVPNVATLASSEWGLKVDDDSYTRQFNQLLLQNPDADWINQTAQQAADAKFNLGDAKPFVGYLPPNDLQRTMTQAFRQGTIDRPVGRDLSPAEAHRAMIQTMVSARDEFLANGGELPGDRDRSARNYATLDRNGVGSFRIQRPDEKRAKSGSAGETQKEEDPEDTDKTQPDGDEEEFVPEGLAAAKAAGKDALGGCVGTRCRGPAFDDGDDDHDAVSSTKIRTRSRPPKRTRRTESVAIFVSSDPNEILGPAGAGVERWIADAGGLDYGIFFENLGPGSSTIPPGQEPAEAPATIVDVTTIVDSDVDRTSFSLGTFGFGAVGAPSGYPLVEFVPPPGAQEFSGEQTISVPVFGTGEDPVDLVVRGEASFDPDTGVARWTITGLDPDTGEVPVDALVGFLPPEDGTGSGQGFASYSAVPLPGSTTGTTIDAAASIVFDLNDPIDTNVWTNTVDAGAPDGTVDDLPGSTPGPVPVSWSATDDGSGPATYDVWVSVDGGPLEIWQNDTTDTAGDYPGEPGHSYGFAVAATDAVGHAEPAPTDAATTTTVEFPAPEPVDDDAQTDEDTAVTVDVLANDPEGLSIVSVGDAVHGDVEIDGNRVTYTPDDDFHGDDTFTYTVVDEHDQEATATVRMTVTPVNDPPVARDDEATTAEATAVTVAVLDNDTDVDGDPLVVASFTQGGHGLVAAAPGGGLTYTPEGGFAGTDTFEYTAADPSGAESTATVRIEVEGGDGCTVTGTERPDILTGTSGPDVICGLGGGDLLIGFGGDDILIGGDGPDVLFGGSGDDTLLGGDGHDVLFGGSGHDRLEGGPGVDFLFGGSGRDVLLGGPDFDFLFGGSGRDTCEKAWWNLRSSCERRT